MREGFNKFRMGHLLPSPCTQGEGQGGGFVGQLGFDPHPHPNPPPEYMGRGKSISRSAAILVMVLTALLGSARGDDFQISAAGPQVPLAYRNVGVVEHLDTQLPLDARLYDEDGQYVTLRQLLKPNRPMLLQLGYLGCPMLCDTISHSLVDSARKIDLDIGKDFDYVFISIDPTDTPTLATLKRNSYVTEYDKPGSAGGFHFLVAKPNEIAEFANAVGFGFKAAQNGQFAHPAVAMVITPEGRISRYLYPPKKACGFPDRRCSFRWSRPPTE